MAVPNPSIGTNIVDGYINRLGTGPMTVRDEMYTSNYVINRYDQRITNQEIRTSHDSPQTDHLKRLLIDILSEQATSFRKLNKEFIYEICSLKEEITELRNDIGGIREENEELKMMLNNIMDQSGISNG